MADKFGFGTEIREIKIGQSFLNPDSTAFHTIRYDFKPASVDVNKIATVDVANNSQVTVTVPHLDGAGTQQTVFKGSQKSHGKECVLIIDKVTGEIVLERLNSNIILKKTRSASAKPALHERGAEKNPLGSLNAAKAQTSPVGRRTSSKTKVTSGGRRAERNITHVIPKHSPLQSSPNYPSPKREHHGAHSENPNALASLPMIGLDDFGDVPANGTPAAQPRVEKSPPFDAHSDNEANGVGEMSDSSSSSNSSDSDSDNDATAAHNAAAGANGVGSAPNLASAHDLTEDLCLSDTGSSDSE